MAVPSNIMDIWDRQSYETEEAYKAFSAYLESDENKNAKFYKKFNWLERKESYLRHKEIQLKQERSNMIKEQAYTYIEDLASQMSALLLTTKLYHQDLNAGGLDKLKGLSTLEKRELSIQDLELRMKMGKYFKEMLELTPEGRELLRTEDSSGKVIINITPAVIPEEKVIEIDITEAKQPQIEES